MLTILSCCQLENAIIMISNGNIENVIDIFIEHFACIQMTKLILFNVNKHVFWLTVDNQNYETEKLL